MSTSTPLTLGVLRDRFLWWLGREVEAGRTRPRTLAYYEHQLEAFVDDGLVDRPVAELVPWDLESRKTGWHSVQVPQRLLNWSVKVGLVKANPFAGVELPAPGQRRRTLTRPQTALLLRRAYPAFRRFLAAMRHTLARPQELRALTWADLRPDGRSFVLSEFKGRNRRKDGVTVRVIALDPYMQRWLARRRRRDPRPSDPVFTNRFGRAWTSNALRCAMRRTRRRAGLVDGGELVVCYTMRHTGATEATAAGVLDRQLADVLGHTSTRTTARYQHLGVDHLVEAIDRATSRRRRA